MSPQYTEGKTYGELPSESLRRTERTNIEDTDYWRSHGLSYNPLPEQCSTKSNSMRTFESGATRNNDVDKLDYEGFLSPIVLERYAQYLHKHRIQADGKIRESDNWQKGIPKSVYLKSAFRHFMTLWTIHRGYDDVENIDDALCGVLFNVMGYLHEYLIEVDHYNRSVGTDKTL